MFGLVDFYQIRSPLSQITEERMGQYIRALSDALGEPLPEFVYTEKL